MVDAKGERAKPRPAHNPGGAVQPQDLPELPARPSGEQTLVGGEGGEAVISTEIGGNRIDLRLPVGGDRAPEDAPPPP
jgi:penicillin-binding protein 1A